MNGTDGTVQECSFRHYTKCWKAVVPPGDGILSGAPRSWAGIGFPWLLLPQQEFCQCCGWIWGWHIQGMLLDMEPHAGVCQGLLPSDFCHQGWEGCDRLLKCYFYTPVSQTEQADTSLQAFVFALWRLSHYWDIFRARGVEKFNSAWPDSLNPEGFPFPALSLWWGAIEAVSPRFNSGNLFFCFFFPHHTKAEHQEGFDDAPSLLVGSHRPEAWLPPRLNKIRFWVLQEPTGGMEEVQQEKGVLIPCFKTNSQQSFSAVWAFTLLCSDGIDPDLILIFHLQTPAWGHQCRNSARGNVIIQLHFFTLLQAVRRTQEKLLQTFSAPHRINQGAGRAFLSFKVSLPKPRS